MCIVHVLTIKLMLAHTRAHYTQSGTVHSQAWLQEKGLAHRLQCTLTPYLSSRHLLQVFGGENRLNLIREAHIVYIQRVLGRLVPTVYRV